ncbi:hypothetical protein [Streptomyces violaceusniger]|uniref:Acyl-CoA oxidase C-terminal domain-containing protein n=1 Tax=Streptomyces violaceusniger (strain Tu 4113) TaxID=653045 RepID=G2PHK2_STRV4|nr:hypothetical protein [Streptomyces violaceusniger]AEM89005.1 hypothetical protein Strvi_0232 [Streptomyces violaceusniger Tu 4113]
MTAERDLAAVAGTTSDSTLERLDALLAKDVFQPHTGAVDHHHRTYARLRLLLQELGGPSALNADAPTLLTAMGWAAQVDPPLYIALLTTAIACMGPMLDLGEPSDYLQELIGEIDSGRRHGAVLTTELGHGCSHINPGTEARYNQAERTFTLHTPHPDHVKIMGNVALPGQASAAVVYAQLIVDGQPRGVYPFAIRVREEHHTPPTLHIRTVGDVTLLPLDYATVRFEQHTIPYGAWLAGGARIDRDGSFHDAHDPGARLVRSWRSALTIAAGTTEALAAAARAACTITHHAMAHRPTQGMPHPGATVADYSLQQHALAASVLDTITAGLLARRARTLHAQPHDSAVPAAVTWAPWVAAHRDLALLKARARDLAEAAVARLRPRLGAHGTLATNQLTAYEGMAQVVEAATGDKVSILLEAGKDLLASDSFPDGTGTLGRARAREHLLRRAVRRAVGARNISSEKPAAFAVYNPHLPALVELAEARADCLMLAAVDQAVQASLPLDTDLAAAVQAVAHLAETTYLTRHLGFLLAHRLIPSSEAKVLPERHIGALNAVAAHLPVLIASFTVPAARTAAPITYPDYAERLTGWTFKETSPCL